MGKIANLPLIERPREKGLLYGVDSLSDQELLAILLSTGYQGTSVNQLAANLLETFGGLEGLSKASLRELKNMKGISDAKALTLLSTFQIHKRLSHIHLFNSQKELILSLTTKTIYQKFKEKLEGASQEYLIFVGVNRSKNLLVERTLYIGTDSEIVISHQDIFRVALNYHCYGFYLIHNHPGCDSRPSPRDLLATDEIIRVGKSLGIKLLDHIIIGKDGYYSFANCMKDEK